MNHLPNDKIYNEKIFQTMACYMNHRRTDIRLLNWHTISQAKPIKYLTEPLGLQVLCSNYHFSLMITCQFHTTTISKLSFMTIYVTLLFLNKTTILYFVLLTCKDPFWPMCLFQIWILITNKILLLGDLYVLCIFEKLYLCFFTLWAQYTNVTCFNPKPWHYIGTLSLAIIF
jgi:hypothetical protein